MIPGLFGCWRRKIKNNYFSKNKFLVDRQIVREWDRDKVDRLTDTDGWTDGRTDGRMAVRQTDR
jgi:hypothetical protein